MNHPNPSGRLGLNMKKQHFVFRLHKCGPNCQKPADQLMLSVLLFYFLFPIFFISIHSFSFLNVFRSCFYVFESVLKFSLVPNGFHILCQTSKPAEPKLFQLFPWYSHFLRYTSKTSHMTSLSKIQTFTSEVKIQYW